MCIERQMERNEGKVEGEDRGSWERNNAKVNMNKSVWCFFFFKERRPVVVAGWESVCKGKVRQKDLTRDGSGLFPFLSKPDVFRGQGKRNRVETGPQIETNGGKDRLFFTSVSQVVCIFHLVSCVVRQWKGELTTLRLISYEFPFNSACGLAAVRGI